MKIIVKEDLVSDEVALRLYQLSRKTPIPLGYVM